MKVLKEGASELDKIKFLQEAAIMCQFKHPNVVRLHGVIKEKDMVSRIIALQHMYSALNNYCEVYKMLLILQLMIVTEYLTKGDLRKCLEEMMPKLVVGLLKSIIYYCTTLVNKIMFSVFLALEV